MTGTQGGTMTAGDVQLIRRAVLAAMVVFLSLAGHAVGRGAVPTFGGLLLAILLASGMTMAVTGQRRSFVWLLAFLLLAQLLIHAVLVVSHSHADAGGMAPPLVPTGSAAVAHAVASVAAAVVLAHGDAVLESWCRLVSTPINAWVLPVLVPQVPSTPAVPREPWSVIDGDHRWDVARRGPPVAVAA